MRESGPTPTADAAGGRAAVGVGRLSSFKGLTSVNAMTTTQRRTQVLADLKSTADRIKRDIAAMEVKTEFYGRECSDGPEAYENEMRPHIAKAGASLREVEALIAELEATPVQLSLL